MRAAGARRAARGARFTVRFPEVYGILTDKSVPAPHDEPSKFQSILLLLRSHIFKRQTKPEAERLGATVGHGGPSPSAFVIAVPRPSLSRHDWARTNLQQRIVRHTVVVSPACCDPHSGIAICMLATHIDHRRLCSDGAVFFFSE